MKLCFDSIEEVQAFVKQLKGTRGGKGKDDGENEAATGNAPAPLQPPAGGQHSFAPASTAGASAAPVGGFPGVGGPGTTNAGFPAAGPAPEVLSIVSRIISKTDASLQAGQGTPEQVLQWFRNQCGPEAANMTLDQVKTIALPRLPMPTLENMAKLIAA